MAFADAGIAACTYSITTSNQWSARPFKHNRPSAPPAPPPLRSFLQAAPSPHLSQDRRRILEAAELQAEPGEIVAQRDAPRLPAEGLPVVLHRPPVVVRADQRPADLCGIIVCTIGILFWFCSEGAGDVPGVPRTRRFVCGSFKVATIYRVLLEPLRYYGVPSGAQPALWRRGRPYKTFVSRRRTGMLYFFGTMQES